MISHLLRPLLVLLVWNWNCCCFHCAKEGKVGESAGPPGFTFSTVSGSKVNVFLGERNVQNDVRLEPEFRAREFRNRSFGRFEKEWIFEELGVWDPPWSYQGLGESSLQQDEGQVMGSKSKVNGNANRNRNTNTNTNAGKEGGDEEFSASLLELEGTLSRVKVLPDEHHVSAYLNKGVVKRFLFLNDKGKNPLSITITPCTSILLWVVRFWPIEASNSTFSLGPASHVKTYRTQRPVTFSETAAPRGVYTLDIRPINWDSYVHIYATSRSSDGSKTFSAQESESGSETGSGRRDEDKYQFQQHVFNHVEIQVLKDSMKKETGNPSNSRFPDVSELDFNFNANLENANAWVHSQGQGQRPRVWAQRLSGNRLQVKWDTSPWNPHLMQYCLVLSTRRDYSSLCSAQGERFGVLPPDLMHVPYYGQVQGQGQGQGQEEQDLQSKHKRRHAGHHQKSKSSSIRMGCVGKKTSLILSNLEEGRLYYLNLFLRDSITNVSYPYVRSTIKVQPPLRKGSNYLRDSKPMKIAWKDEDLRKTCRTKNVKFNLNKPCSEMSLYVMPCGGGAVRFELVHVGINQTIYASEPIDSFEILKVSRPQKGKYCLRVSQVGEKKEKWVGLVEVLVVKKNKRFPLPKLPAITKISEDLGQRSCDSVTIQWWPSPDGRDNEYCIFLKEENRQRQFNFKKPNQCDVYRSLRSDPYVTHSLCVQKKVEPEMMMLSQRIVGLQPGKTYEVQVVIKRHNGKALSYDLHFVKTLPKCSE